MNIRSILKKGSKDFSLRSKWQWKMLEMTKMMLKMTVWGKDSGSSPEW